MVSKYPHTATISWTVMTREAGTGNWISGDSTSITVKCRFEQTGRVQYDDLDGKVHKLEGFKVWLKGVYTTIPETAIITIDSQTYNINRVLPYQKSTCLWL